jgi:DNA polymerase-1
MKTVILDCSYIGHRSKYSMGKLSYREKQTGVIFALLSKTVDMAVMFKTNKICFAWDSVESLRKQILPTYKNRDEKLTPQELELNALVKEQLAITRLEVLPRIGFKNSFLAPGYEADDIIASLVNSLNDPENTVVVARDKDLYQLLDQCNIYNLETKKMYTKESLKNEWNCTPEQWRMVKAMAGCETDNVKGITGVAEKTAIKYLRRELKPSHSVFLSILKSSDIIDLNKRLTSIPFENCPQFSLEEESFCLDDFMEICQDYGFNSFVDKTKRFNQWREVFKMERRKK